MGFSERDVHIVTAENFDHSCVAASQLLQFATTGLQYVRGIVGAFSGERLKPREGLLRANRSYSKNVSRAFNRSVPTNL